MEDISECEEGEGAEKGSRSLEARRGTPPHSSVVADFALALIFVIGDETDGCGEDSGKGEKESSNNRAITHGDVACGRGDGSSEDKPKSVLVRLGEFGSGEIGFDDH